MIVWDNIMQFFSSISFIKEKNMPCAVFRFLQFIGTGYNLKLFVIVVVAVKYEIITIRESIPLLLCIVLLWLHSYTSVHICTHIKLF